LRNSVFSANQYANLCYDEQGSILLDLNIDKPLLQEGIDDPLENLDKEYQTLGIMLSDNPLRYKKDLLVSENVVPIVNVNESFNFKVAGILKFKKTINTKKGTTMAFIKIFDETGEMEITIFPDLYQESLLLLERNNILLIEGKMEINKDERTYIARKVSLLEE
jgi:DNA polymerase-3 subunit alpha